MHLTARIVAVFLIILLSFVACGDAATVDDQARPILELDPALFEVVEPFRYNESRRYEGGWNRGVDAVLVAGRVVQSPVDGRVRFAGSVAGRHVVTLDATIDRVPVVVTLTGLDGARVIEGERVQRGDVIGGGSRVQVGMYDPDRRSRYLPVVVAQGPAPAADSGPPTAGVVLAAGVTDRLREAILGEVETSVLGGGAVASGAGPAARSLPIQVTPMRREGAVALPVRTSNASAGAVRAVLAAAALVDDRSGAVPAEMLAVAAGNGTAVSRVGTALEIVSNATGGATSSHEDPRGGSASARLRGGSVVSGARPMAGAGTSAPDPQSVAERREAGSDGPSGVGATPTPRAGASADAIATPADPDVAVVATDPPGGSSDVEPSTLHPSSTTARESPPTRPTLLLVPLLLVVAGLVVRRRRVRRTPGLERAPTVVFQPSPPVLPERLRIPLASVETDGMTIVPRAQLAWSNREPGTLPDTHATTDTPARPRRRAREPA